MSSLIKNLRIQNFKSIRDLSLDCERINVFIGKPNAGKSNIQEAVSLLGGGGPSISTKFMDGCIRYKNIADLFFNFDFQKPIEITANGVLSKLSAYESNNLSRYEEQAEQFWFRGGYFGKSTKKQFSRITIPDVVVDMKPDGSIIGTDFRPLPQKGEEIGVEENKILYGHNPIRKYTYRSIGDYQEKGLFLNPPYGENLYLIIKSNTELRSEIKIFIEANGLKLLINEGTKQFSFIKETDDRFIEFPMYLIPDTFQRYIFHLAAIMSNRNSVLLFEEPESHSYGPYIYELAQHILNDEGGNQFFLTTHNPYLLLPLMQEKKDVAVFTTWFENYQTHAKRLSDEEVNEILDYGMDIFLNLDSFIPE